MHEFRKILKRSAGWLFMIIILLVVQAICDLSLPSYTSDIVNVGIQQGGIKTSYPEYVSNATLKTMKLFATDEEAEIIDLSYDKLSSGSEEYEKIKKHNPDIADSLYAVKSDLTEEQLDSLETAATEPFLLAVAVTGKSESVSQLLGSLPEGASLDKGLSSPEQAAAIRQKAATMLSGYDESTVKQMAVTFVKQEYTNVGVNTDRIQNMYLFLTGLKMLGVAAVAMAAAIAVSYLAAIVSARCGRDMRHKIFSKVLKFTNTEFDEFSTASLITRSTNDIQQIQMLIVMIARMVLYAPIVGIGAFIKVLGSNVSMSWVIGLAVIVILSLVIVLLSITMPKFQLVQKQVDKVNLVAREILTGLSVIRAFTNEKHEEKRFDKANTELTKTNLFVNRIMTAMMPTMMLVMNAISVLIVWVGAKYIDSGSMMVGDLMAFIQYTMQIIIAFLMISMVSIMLPRAIVSVKRIAEVFDKEISLQDPDVPQEFDEDQKGTVEFRDVYFRYPNAEEDVLNNISFSAKKGQTTAFIGSTGSGKSTLINLIPRFFDVTGGKILVDGCDVRDVSQKSLREKIGYVPQKGVLFSGTVASNIAYGKEDMQELDIKRAAQIAQAEEFIETMPDKYQNPISQGGTNVSGGQKQRLSIARAIARKPEILIFDDSFSALDFKTDAKLRKALAEQTSESTVFIVAQRISTVMNADQIVVLDDGHVVGIGTHKELMQSCEVYKQIALSQLSKEELENE